MTPDEYKKILEYQIKAGKRADKMWYIVIVSQIISIILLIECYLKLIT